MKNIIQRRHKGCMGKILVVGGAGYIGSHMVHMLETSGYKTVTFDDLSTGFRDAVLVGEFIHGSLHDKSALKAMFKAHRFDAVFHFAGSIAVGESVIDPEKYYLNNISGSLNLFEAMRDHGVLRLVFSSTASIFGMPQYVPINESHPQSPINPYGMTKWMTERILQDYDAAYGFRSVALRYFNAAGASLDASLGERHNPETHLIPLALRVAKGELPILTIFGSDYDTPDGTCIRDYVHVLDLCSAHILALQHLMLGGSSRSYNLGNGYGHSVKEVVQAVEFVSGKKLPVQYGVRRQGDPDRLIADSSKIQNDWKWNPSFSDLNLIVAHAWQWECKQVLFR